MTRYDKMFARLAVMRSGAFVPFAVIGDPNPGLSLDIIKALVDGGADALELGIPFSDPIADGPTIQAAAVRALKSGTTSERCWDIVGRIRSNWPDIPIGLLVYANLAVSKGETVFYKRAAKAGVDSVLVADVPIFEAEPFVKAAEEKGIQPVFIATPNAGDERLKQIASLTKGYTYVVARPGVTGADDEIDLSNKRIFGLLKGLGAPPCLLGFGISKPTHAMEAIQSGAAGVICGSAVANIIGQGANDPGRLMRELASFVKEMKQATHICS